MLQITKSDYQKILNHAIEGLPNEACGLIAGVVENDVKVVKEVYLLTNVDASNEHFSMDPKEQFSALKDMRAKGYQQFGNWHSHPESPSRPSEEDKRLAYDSNADYLILSLQDRENPVLNAFLIKNRTEVSREEIQYV
ncbi:MAG: M67 family metallopeptidase [Suilimivivens sp.]